MTGNNYAYVIRLLVTPTEKIPRGYVASKDGREIADGTNGISGIVPYDIETDLETVVARGHDEVYVMCAEDISKNTIVTYDATGKAIAYTGSGVQIGKTLQAGTTDQLCKIYTYPVWGAGDKSDTQSYIITGGNSSDTLTDNLVDYIALTQYKIEGTSYEYPGGTDVAGTSPSQTNGKVWLGTDNDVHFGLTAPGDSIIIATYDTDATGVITRYEPLEQFAILSTVDKLIEGKNEVVTTATGINKSYTGTDITLTWASPIRIDLMSISAGASKHNVINAGTVNLSGNELAYVTLNRNVAGAVLTLTVIDRATADLTANDKVIFYRIGNEVYSPYFSFELLEEQDTVTGTAGENIAAYDVVYFTGSTVNKAGSGVLASIQAKKGIALNTA